MRGSGPEITDDLGLPVPLAAVVRRVVSLVPSLTEAVAPAGLLVGVTRWCTHPADLTAERVGGTKNPDVARIVALSPDLAALRAAGVPVWVTRVRSLPEGLASLHRMLTLACRLPGPAWLEAAAAAWQQLPPRPRRAAVIPVWRRRWMVLGRDTFAGDLLARLGVVNLYAGHEERYPRIGLAELRGSGADLVVLPDEPYRFSETDGPEAFPGVPAALVSGRHLTWYGPSLAEAPAVLGRQLAQAVARQT